MSAEHIEDLQIRMAYQEDAIQELNNTVYQQQLQIDELGKMIEMLKARIKEIQVTNIVDESEETPPPHY